MAALAFSDEDFDSEGDFDSVFLESGFDSLFDDASVELLPFAVDAVSPAGSAVLLPLFA
ncbi:MAG: hypothetical protein ACLQAT_10975 [Candidatus Binataceae bacterium]